MPFAFAPHVGHVLVLEALLGARPQARYGNYLHLCRCSASVEVAETARALADCSGGTAYIDNGYGLPAAIVVGSDGVVWGLHLKPLHEVLAGL
ncbi:hypothetical protein Sipo8835_22965 [Streptomyces ipomoeae]|uniref:Uncharacterized protein n=1 Tax=Streptomyces ipomoeae TaxID=103232 RepID=A0AAE8W0E4_9ACTN|nr:hypothetical protein [Streptomyces ipomoeae]TQE30857.1 hypothetical protein Sipo8835_22965 [Streptomyces ipomoeae]